MFGFLGLLPAIICGFQMFFFFAMHLFRLVSSLFMNEEVQPSVVDNAISMVKLLGFANNESSPAVFATIY